MKRKRKKTGKYTVVIEVTNTGYSAYLKNLKEYGVYTTGSTITELMNNVIEATNLMLEDTNQYVTINNFRPELDFQQFFNHYKVINATHLADRIGMSPSLLSQYARGRKRPSAKQQARILGGIHEVARELNDINLV